MTSLFDNFDKVVAYSSIEHDINNFPKNKLKLCQEIYWK